MITRKSALSFLAPLFFLPTLITCSGSQPDTEHSRLVKELVSQFGGAPSFCTISMPCKNGATASCIAVGVARCQKEDAFVRCQELGNNTKDSFACCNESGTAFVTLEEDDAKTYCVSR